jgi:hypothetical protein
MSRSDSTDSTGTFRLLSATTGTFRLLSARPGVRSESTGCCESPEGAQKPP